MYKFSKLSKRRMKGVDSRLISIAELALKRSPCDFGIAWMGGKRTAREQYDLFLKKRSQKDGYNRLSKHQFGEALDILPYVNGEPKELKNYYLIVIGVFFACANELGYTLRSGANWDKDQVWLTDQSFDDYPHLEIVNSG